MEFDLLFNFVAAFFIILLIFVTIITIIQKLKLRWPVKVNCWFCNNNTKIWRQQLNWWRCPHCEQYNGFTKSGDYAYNIPEQYKISSNEIKRYCTSSQDTLASKDSSNDLCKHCNINEALKISKLSDYVPKSEKNYEYEIKQFRNSLEQQYPLCANCKNLVHNVLNKQAVWLARYKMLFFKQQPFYVIANSTKYSEPVCRTISTILSSMIAYNTDLVYLPIGGLFFQLCACWSTSSRKRNSDILLMFLWICMIVLLPFKDAKLIKTDLQNPWFSLEYITHYHMIMLFVLVIGFINIKPKSHKSTVNKNISFKKIESSTKNTELPNLYTKVLNDKHNFNPDIVNNDINKTVTNQSLSLPNTMKHQMPLYTENSISSTSTGVQTPFKNHESQLSSLSSKDSSTIFNSTPIYKKDVTENFSLNDSLTTLSMLSLSEDKPKYTIKAPKIFEKRVYGTNGLELFKKSAKRHILSPPKLKSVTQTSWVAGGYWQEDINAPSLSRSSSQSSGFGSTCSNFAPSREPSVHEFDQCSIMSDVTQSCSTLRQNNFPVGSFNQQNPYFSFSEQKSSVSNQTMKGASPNFYTQQSFLLPEAYKKNKSVFMDQCVQGQNVNVSDIKNPSEIQMFPSHTTIVTSPVWLPALLCGSLVLNIVVLCTTLLR